MKEFYVICDNIRSLENIGSIFRTADALGVSKIFLCGISGRPPHHKISKTALGAEKTVSWEYCRQTGRLIDKMKKGKIHPVKSASQSEAVSRKAGQFNRVNIVALEQDLPARQAGKKAIVYTKFRPKFPLALIIGNEVKGISKRVLEKADKIIYLPMSGQKESLNVSVSFGVAGYYINNLK